MTNLFVDNADSFDKTFRGMTAPEDFWDVSVSVCPVCIEPPR